MRAKHVMDVTAKTDFWCFCRPFQAYEYGINLTGAMIFLTSEQTLIIQPFSLFPHTIAVLGIKKRKLAVSHRAWNETIFGMCRKLTLFGSRTSLPKFVLMKNKHNSCIRVISSSPCKKTFCASVITKFILRQTLFSL